MILPESKALGSKRCKRLTAILWEAHRLRLQAFPVQADYAHVPGPKSGVVLPNFSQTQRATETRNCILDTLRW